MTTNLVNKTNNRRRIKPITFYNKNREWYIYDELYFVIDLELTNRPISEIYFFSLAQILEIVSLLIQMGIYFFAIESLNAKWTFKNNLDWYYLEQLLTLSP